MTVIPDRRSTSALARETPPVTINAKKVTARNGRPPGTSGIVQTAVTHIGSEAKLHLFY